MAVTKKVYNICKNYFNDPSIKIAELGAQYVMGEEWGEYGPPYFKNVFNHLDITSFDYIIENGCHFMDLTKPVDQSYYGRFDLITNFGTTEHVQNQYICWKNIFEMCKENGIVINEIPKKGYWPNHCKYYFDESTFESLYKDFEIIDLQDVHYDDQGYLIYCVLKKIHSDQFKTEEFEFLDKIQIIPEYQDKIGF